MSDTKDNHEPSMEEILASIRRIISEDDPPAEAAAAPAAEPAPAPVPAAGAAPQAPMVPPPPAPAHQAAAPVVPPPAAAPAVDNEDDILMLTEEVEDAPPPPAPEPVLETVEADPFTFEADPEPPEAPPVAVAPPVLQPAPVAPPAAPAHDTSGRLLSDSAAAASLAALTELVTRSHREPQIESLPMGNANRTLEDLTSELLRPILKSWLDENLPQIVERVVREEIGRLAIDAQRR